MHPKNMTISELLREAEDCDGHSLLMSEALAFHLGEALGFYFDKAQEAIENIETPNKEDKTHWTVVLDYPHYLQNSGDDALYRAQVTADTPKAAVYRARMNAHEDNLATLDPDDFGLLVLFQGWHDDMGYLA